MPSHEMRRNLASITIFVLPVIAVKLATAILGGPGPAQAQAEGLEVVPAAGGAQPAKAAIWTEDQLAAAHHIDSLRAQPFGSTPLLHDIQEPDVTPDPPPIDPIEPDAVPTFVLQAVMSGESGDRALINGRPYRENDEIRGTIWSVVTIDTSNAFATLKNAKTGKTIIIRVELPRNLGENPVED